MKLWIAAALIASALGYPSHARSIPDPAHIALVTAQQAWVFALEQCESSGNPLAVNRRDVDGTASYGAFQFKPGTFAELAKKYGVAGKLMDERAQRAIVLGMINDPSFTDHDLEYQQFPDCIQHKIGLPPNK